MQIPNHLVPRLPADAAGPGTTLPVSRSSMTLSRFNCSKFFPGRKRQGRHKGVHFNSMVNFFFIIPIKIHALQKAI